jgi:hypothetical protein
MLEERFRPGGPLVRNDGSRRKRVKFPIENQADYKAFIKFQPIITDPPALGNDFAKLGELVKNSTDKIMGVIAGTNAVDTAAGFNAGRDDGNLGSPAGNNVSPNGDNGVGNNLLKNSKKRNSQNSCVMYMPSSLNFQDGVNYSQADLGVFGAALEAGINSGGSIAGSLGSALGSSIKNVYDAMSGSMNQDAARLMTTKLAGMAGKNGAVDGAVRGSLRTSPIANITMLFDKPNLREFSFTFKMQPVTEEEAKEINNIVKFFRTELYPSTFNYDQGDVSIPFGYRFPNEFNISFHYGLNRETEESRYSTGNFIKLKPCYLKNFTTNFNATNSTFYKGGYFQETSISMTFQENELLDRADIEEGF